MFILKFETKDVHFLEAINYTHDEYIHFYDHHFVSCCLNGVINSRSDLDHTFFSIEGSSTRYDD
jgi:hypothetical protein